MGGNHIVEHHMVQLLSGVHLVSGPYGGKPHGKNHMVQFLSGVHFVSGPHGGKPHGEKPCGPVPFWSPLDIWTIWWETTW